MWQNSISIRMYIACMYAYIRATDVTLHRFLLGGSWSGRFACVWCSCSNSYVHLLIKNNGINTSRALSSYVSYRLCMLCCVNYLRLNWIFSCVYTMLRYYILLMFYGYMQNAHYFILVFGWVGWVVFHHFQVLFHHFHNIVFSCFILLLFVANKFLLILLLRRRFFN